jgi:hypothetical protein
MRALRVVKFVMMFAVMCLVVGYVTERLWNWLVPSIFHLRVITYWEAVGLLVLSKILLGGGVHRHGGGRGGRHWKERRAWKKRMKMRWQTMSPEERERFRGAMKERWGGRCGGFREHLMRDDDDVRQEAAGRETR